MLTADNSRLQKQTYERSLASLQTFNICGENDFIRFTKGRMRRPVLIVLKKNTNILGKWINDLKSSDFCQDRPVFIIDDEADAASLNTKINLEDQSAINRHLENLKKIGNSSIYLQVTANPASNHFARQANKVEPVF